MGLRLHEIEQKSEEEKKKNGQLKFLLRFWNTKSMVQGHRFSLCKQYSCSETTVVHAAGCAVVPLDV